MPHDPNDTIVAVSSAPGPGARAIVRLSGPAALTIVSRVFSPTESVPSGRGWCTGSMRLPGIAAPLPAELYSSPGPRSATGQDIIELHARSCPPLIELLVAALLDAGARGATPGEFTLRAFLAGKIDLPQAEAVLGIIEARNSDDLSAALAQYAGGASRPLQALRDDLLNLLADVEAGLDFAEEDLGFAHQDELLQRLIQGLAQVTLVQKQLAQRAVSDHPYRVVLVGRPNAGKSSLLNAVAGTSAALVSSEPGTTRDYLSCRLDLDGLVVELVDTAGRAEAFQSIEIQSQDLGHRQAQAADLLLLCQAVDSAPDAAEAALLHQEEPPALAVATKCDLAPSGPTSLATSAKTGLGLPELRQLLRELASTWRPPALAPSLSRCRHHVERCLQSLRRAHTAVLYEDPPEILALELRGALEELGEMVGAIYTDELLDRIFSRFCIGK